MRVLVIGAGVAGLCCAIELARAGASVEIIERGPALGRGACSWFAGGMLAPYCEGESADPLVTRLGAEAISWWQELCPDLVRAGTLVLAQERDRDELTSFARRTHHHRLLNEQELAQLEPDLSGRFRRALYYGEEAHLDPRRAMVQLEAALHALGVEIQFDSDLSDYTGPATIHVDCRGLAARDRLPELRGVKGEMLLIRSDEIEVRRPLRLLHPRIPLYIVPRAEHLFMVGATMIESDDRKRISARSMIELLQAAYALHPVFAEAEIVEIGTDVRPAFVDNLPAIRRIDNTIFLNGLYRHGFLLSPAFATYVKDIVLHNARYPELLHADPMQRQSSSDSITNPRPGPH